MPGIIGTTQATGVSKATHGMDDRAARAGAIAQSISNNTSAGQARDLLMGMRNTLRAENNGDETLLRLVHTTKTERMMAFESLNKKWGNSTRTLETKAALIAEFEKAGWDTSDLKAYLDPVTTRGDRIYANDILEILENASAKAETEGPDFRFNAAETTVAWTKENTRHAPDLGKGGFGSVQQMKFNGEPMAVKTLKEDEKTVLPSVSLDESQITPHIKREREVTAAFIKSDTNSVIKPKYFMVQVTQHSGELEHLLVKGGKDFKEWSKALLWNSETSRPRVNAPTIHVTGLAMPLADGKTLGSALKENRVNFKQTAESSLNSLIQLSRHGFVHGDIKPDNLILRNDGVIAMIDTGSMAKISEDAVNRRKFPHPSDSFDKFNRPTTKNYAHPGHPPDFQKVGMEQDLFSMGVTLLDTKLQNIAKTLQPDEAEDFHDAANQILNTIKEENDALDAHSADTIREEIRTQLEDLKYSHPGAFADGELDWAKQVIGTALDQTRPAIDREEWATVLTDLRDKVPVDSADGQQVLARLQSIGCNSQAAAMQKINDLRSVIGSVTEKETSDINQKFFGGGNGIFSVLYENPGLLDANLSSEDRQTAFFEAFEPFQAIAREKNERDIESKVQELIEAGDPAMAERVRTALLDGANASEEANKADIVKSLADSDSMDTFRKFRTAASQHNLSTQDAMTAIRSRTNILKLDTQKVAQDLTDLFANRHLGRGALTDIQTLFPPAST